MKPTFLIITAFSLMAILGLSSCEKKSDEAYSERLAIKRTHLTGICLQAYDAYLDTLALYPVQYSNSDEIDAEKLIAKERFLSYSDKTCTQVKQKYDAEAKKAGNKKVKNPTNPIPPLNLSPL